MFTKKLMKNVLLWGIKKNEFKIKLVRAEKTFYFASIL